MGERTSVRGGEEREGKGCAERRQTKVGFGGQRRRAYWSDVLSLKLHLAFVLTIGWDHSMAGLSDRPKQVASGSTGPPHVPVVFPVVLWLESKVWDLCDPVGPHDDKG